MYPPELEQLGAARARAALQAGDLVGARDHLLKLAELLPEDSGQYRNVRARIGDLSRQIVAAPAAAGSRLEEEKQPAPGRARCCCSRKASCYCWVSPNSAPSSPCSPSSACIGVFTAGVSALGLVLSIYVHEMGHVSVLRRYGIPASAPMFIPFLGAVIGVRGASSPQPHRGFASRSLPARCMAWPPRPSVSPRSLFTGSMTLGAL